MEGFDDTQVANFNSDANPGSFPLACLRSSPTSGNACLYKISWTLTTDATAVIDGLLPGHPTSLLALADTANADFLSWVGRQPVKNQRLGHILIGDDFTSGPLFGVVLAQNLKMGREMAEKTELIATI
jgi:hypothetical protein